MRAGRRAGTPRRLRPLSGGFSADDERLPVVEGYELQARIALGGMSSVFRAVAHASGEPVALKILSANHLDDERVVKRFTSGQGSS